MCRQIFSQKKALKSATNIRENTAKHGADAITATAEDPEHPGRERKAPGTTKLGLRSMAQLISQDTF
jgi:hypothetical protein